MSCNAERLKARVPFWKAWKNALRTPVNPLNGSPLEDVRAGPTSQGEGSHAGRVAPCSTGWRLTLVLSRILRESMSLTLGALIEGLACVVSCVPVSWFVGVAKKGTQSTRLALHCALRES